MIEQLLEHSGWARRLARGLVRDAGRADDAVQDAWVAALSRPPTHSTNLRAWFGFLVRRSARHIARADERREIRDRAAAMPEGLAASDALERAELQRVLVEAVLALDDPYRTAIVLAYFEDLRPNEIARRIGVEPATVRSHLHRGLAKLRADLERRGRGREEFLPAIAALALGGPRPLSWPMRGLIMTTKTKIAAAAVVLLAAGSWMWWRAESSARGAEESTPRPAAIADGDRPASPAIPTSKAEPDRTPVVAEAVPPAAAASPDDNEEAELRVRVVDSKDAPIAGASVEILRAEARPYEYLLDHDYQDRETAIAKGKSDDHGEIAFRVPRGRLHDLRVHSETFAERQLSGVRTGETVVIALRPGSSLSGIVRRMSDGAPIAGVQLVLTSEEGFGPMWKGTTDAGGHYSAQGLDPGRAYLLVIPDDELPLNANLELKEGETLVRDFDVPPGLVLEGEVRDRSTGLPIAGAEVSSWSFLHKIARTDSSGHYVLRGVPGGRTYVEIDCRARGYGRSETRLAAQGGPSQRADFELLPSRTARGRIVSRSGEPLSGIYVAAVASRFDHELKISRGDCPSARTDDDGRFAIADLRPDSPHALFLRKEGFATTIVDLGEKESAGSVVDVGDVVLPRMSSLSGGIVGADGAGIADAGIEVQIERPGAAVDLTAIAMQQTSSGPDGRFRVVDLAAGKYRLRIYRTGLPTIERLEVELKEGEARRDFTIRMGGTLRIAGRVLDPDGAPAAGARVYVRGGNLSPSSRHDAVADSGGAFVFAGLEAGEYAVSVEPEFIRQGETQNEWIGSRTETVRAGAEDVVLQLQRRDSIEGRIVPADGGAPVRTWIVAIDPSGSRVSWTVSGSDGSFRLAVGSGTSVELRVWAAKADPQSYWGFSADESTTPIAVVPGVRAGTKDLSIALPR
jgi:RNA polymerase sigma-70 factor (ECF subfamily)